MYSELKRSIYKQRLIAAIASISLGFLTAVIVSNDTNSGYVSGWTWLGGLFAAAIVSLLLFVAGLVLLVMKRELGAVLILSSALVTLSFVMTLFVMEKVGWIFYSHLHNESFINNPNDQWDKPSQ
jgi:hypothetical protein